ncbi:peptide deformylase [Conexibacter stalactiti]|uniref:Peptide deformylase n=1 Tax=Conexibacter stalactiti TaxID=1940611 RepID=A0ABU4HYP5_9ACTN|nr:peptide deformylase [Conexibacter stalactiti]MDW5598348.1 peptide deformylase [Conexibacter stalactiti]MEC5038990.1 peptide deformylase [Conexibacter stalactiti]
MASVSASLASLSLIRTTLAGLDLPGQFLRRTAAPLDFDEIGHAQRRAIVRGLFGAMHAPPGGVGLAAPMAGLDLRLVVASDGEHTLAMANPEVVATGGGEVAYAEGNLCLPGVHAEVVRPATITVRWQDVAARTHEETFDGWIARILFHELELLDGGFFTDGVAPEAIVATTPARRAAAALASVYAEPEPAAPAGAREPLRIVTLPPELHDLRRSVLRMPAAAVAGGGLDQLALRELLATLFLTLHARGVGELSAPQVGIGLRVAVVDDQREPPLALIDATVVERGGDEQAEVEECPSLPGLSCVVDRPERLRVRNHTLAGEPYEFDADGDRARLIAHALDHLDGVLISDHALGGLHRSDLDQRVEADLKLALGGAPPAAGGARRRRRQ